MQEWAINILKNWDSLDSIIEGLNAKLGEDKLKELLTDLVSGESVNLTIGGNYINPKEKSARKKKEADEAKEAIRNNFKRKLEKDFHKEWLQITFIENERFKPVRELIDERFNVFFKKLISLKPPQKEELERDEQKWLEVFYNLIYQRVIQDDFLMHGLEFMKEAKTKKENNNYSIDQKLIIDVGLEHFKDIINDLFEIPSLVLTAFESSVENYEQEVKKSIEKLSDSKKLKPEDEAYKVYMSFVDEMIKQNITKYKVVKNYLIDKSINKSEKSLSNAFDSFLKNHKDEIKEKFNLSENKFYEKFLPATLSQK